MSAFKDQEIVKASQEFTTRYRAAYGIPPDPYAMSAYYGAAETLRAMKLANSFDPKKMYDSLMANPDFNSVKGPAKWRVDGRPRYKYNAWIVEGKAQGSKRPQVRLRQDHRRQGHACLPLTRSTLFS
jgi:branched-chain amino acid transport system substrate-binding protein